MGLELKRSGNAFDVWDRVGNESNVGIKHHIKTNQGNHCLVDLVDFELSFFIV